MLPITSLQNNAQIFHLQNNLHHNNNFDFLRFLFASFVILLTPTPYWVISKMTLCLVFPGRVFSEIGVCGFVISGYLIHQSLERSSSCSFFLPEKNTAYFSWIDHGRLFSAWSLMY